MVGAVSAATTPQRCATDLRNYHRNVAVRFYAATQNVIHTINAFAKGHTQCRANPLCRVCLPCMLRDAAACPGGHGPDTMLPNHACCTDQTQCYPIMIITDIQRVDLS